MNLTTATPAQIDTELSALYQAEFALEAAERSAMAAIHRGLGEKLDTTGRGAYRVEKWPTADADALAAMRSKGEELIGMMRPASAIVTKYAAAADALAANRAAQEPLHGEYNRRGGWTRFYAVPGGHVHRTMHCSTCNNGRERTRFDWLIDWSGRDQAEAIAELAAAAHTLCSQSCCFPGAPTAAAPAPRKTAAEQAADRAAAERTARTEDPKLIADTDGEPLRVDGDVLRTVRTAEIKGADALWWAAYNMRNTTAGASAARYEAHAAQVAAALAHKRGTTAAAELAALVVKATKKVRRDLGADTAATATARWTAQAEAAAAPAPLAEQPQPQHAGRDDQDAPVVRQTADTDAYEAGLAAAAAGAAALGLRMQLAAVGQVTRELTDDQIGGLRHQLGSVRPNRVARPLDPFLAARLILRAGECPCSPTHSNGDCQTHPGFTTPTAALAALAAELEAEAGATWATWEGHGRPAAAMLHGTAGMAVRPAGRGEPATFAADEAGRVVARSVGGRYITTAVASAEWLLTVPPPAGDEAACRFCGCTENAACPGGCAWADDAQIIAAGLEPMDGDVCTACLPAAGDAPAGQPTRQQAYLERDQDQDDEGDEARDCVRVATHTDATGQRFQWCATHRANEPIGPDDDEDLDDAAAFDAGLAEVLAIAAAAPTVTITDPGALLDMVKQYATEWHRFLAMTAETASIDDADRAEAAAGGTLAQIAAALGITGEAAAVPGPRLPEDTPPAR